ncbi:ATP synthase F1 subunit gamma [Buchnera aphidicola (Ceratoglyphina bambusae)]|uniref:ATP synthase F1 subunit gamma n=1 Tax=Buchnera aphidicola TaxID=9 RepID=UPI0031B83871
MLSVKEIRNNISGIKNTNRITKTMEMISISKMKKIYFRMNSSMSYYNLICKVVNNVKNINLEYKHIYLKKKIKVKIICIIILSTDKGLCGNLNINLFSKVLSEIKKYSKKNIKVKLAIIGEKGINFFKLFSKNIIFKISNLKDIPSFSKITIFLSNIIKLYKKNIVEKIYLAGNNFISSTFFKSSIFRLLPIYKKLHKKKLNKFNWDYIYEPNSKFLLDILFKRYLEYTIYYKILENSSCEQSSRIFSMKQASKNSNDIIKKLQLMYNKSRQANVTKELIEIVSGYSAIL